MILSISNIKKGIRYLKNYGIKEFFIRLKEKSEPEEISYQKWFEKHKVSSKELEAQTEEIKNWPFKPCISICVPMYKTTPKFCIEMIKSVLEQSYDNWELCLADATPDDSVIRVVPELMLYDKRVKYIHLEYNQGIAENTNQAIDLAAGEYIGFLDHDDILAPNALYEVAKAIVFPEDIKQSGYHFNKSKLWLSEEGAPDVIYSDEDKIEGENKIHVAPHFKPDFCLDLLRSNNYFTHFTVVKKSLIEQVGGLDASFDGAQDYDLVLRCVEQANRVVHIPKVLYHWRMHEASTAANEESKTYAFEAGKRAIEAHLKRMGVSAEVDFHDCFGFYRVKYQLDTKPLVSIVIPNKDEVESLSLCIESIMKSTYSNFEVIIVENNSEKEETFAFYEELMKRYPNKIRVATWESNGEFNYSAINNYGVKHAKGDYLILLNNDIELITPGWIEEMLSVALRNEVGIVGARLYYPDDTIQHAGIGVGIGGSARGIASNMLVGTRRIHDGYLHKASIYLDYSAVTAACLMIQKDIFEQVSGFDEKLKVAFNDVDLCLKVRKLGYLIVYNPYVEAYHYESKSRGEEDSEEKLQRFRGEIELMREKWTDILRNGDPYLNPNFSKIKSDYSLNALD